MSEMHLGVFWTHEIVIFYVILCRHFTAATAVIFTREYTQCTAGYTFCFVVVVGVGVGVVEATFSQTWHYFSRQLIKHD
jgi:hypothetical protein